ncbi:MAG: hypothetical protein ACTHW2_01080 [Tissierella sp.]|uniref:GAP1-N2 domain-containing protein n=1 Tax=Tissierella sp. TaxID=41274 RepID=UPI003F9C5279
MTKHQIIYTSCKRGIDGINDGQQVYSYDKNFKKSKDEEVKRLFTYQLPSLEAGVVMTEEIASKMPSSFSYKMLADNMCSITQNTYLGRDYMGSTGRFGNHLSHSIICGNEDLKLYPSELYGSHVLRKSMPYDEVNNPEKPDYLPEPILERGNIVDIDRVISFLESGENLEYYKKMVYAALKFEKDKKRIVICDGKENIIMWIAAIHYSLPLEIAKAVNFTTYEFDPELSSSQICGVKSKGTKYNYNEYISSGRYYVFDFLNFQMSDINPDHDFFNFIDTAISFSYDSLVDFHKFISEKTKYKNLNEEYCSGYYLYELLLDGIEDFDENKFNEARVFSEKYATDDLNEEVVGKLISETDIIGNFNNEFALTIIRYMLQFNEKISKEDKEILKEMIVQRIISLFDDESIEEDSFIDLYNSIDKIAQAIDMSIIEEMVNMKNRESLVNVIEEGISKWKIDFLIENLSKNIKEKKLSTEDLFADKSIGYIYIPIIKSMYSTSRQNGNKAVKTILDKFEFNSLYLLTMTLNIEIVLDEIGLEDSDKKQLWDHFNHLTSKNPIEDISLINSFLNKYNRYEEMYYLYQYRIANEKDLKEIRKIFIDTLEGWFSKSKDYEKDFALKVVATYVKAHKEKLDSLAKEEKDKYVKELFSIFIERKIKDEYADFLIEHISKGIALEKSSPENKKLIMEMLKYQHEINSKKIDGKLLLFYIAILLEEKVKIENIMETIRLYGDEEGAKLEKVGEKLSFSYFKWIVPEILRRKPKSHEWESIYGLFTMSKKSQEDFFEYCNQEYLEKIKQSNTYKELSEFLKFMFENGDSKDIKNAGKVFCKLNKKDLEDMDKKMKRYYKDDKDLLEDWEEVREVAESTSSVIQSISGIFKRRK